MTIEAMKKLVPYFRHKEYGLWEQRITSPAVANISESDKRPFLQFKFDVNINGTIEKVAFCFHTVL